MYAISFVYVCSFFWRGERLKPPTLRAESPGRELYGDKLEKKTKITNKKMYFNIKAARELYLQGLKSHKSQNKHLGPLPIPQNKFQYPISI